MSLPSVPLLGALLAALAFAAPASAAVRTSVTEPADGFATTVTGTGDAHFTASGSSNLPAGATIRVICEARAGAAMTVGITRTRAGGGWSLEVGSADAPFPRGACRLRALPPDPGTDLSRYAGPRISVTRLASWQGVGGGLYDAGFWQSRARGYVDAFSAGDCGLCDMALEDPAHGRRSGFLFYGNGAIPRDERARYGADRAFLRVDGRDAYLPAAAHAVLDAAGAPRLALRALAPGRLDTLEPAARCVSEDATPSGAGCGALVAAGLELARTLRVLGDGTRVRITDRWVSADGAAHALDVDYEQVQAGGAEGGLEYRASWTGEAFEPAVAGGELRPPRAAPVSLLVRPPRGSFDRPAGAITFAPAPALLRFGGGDEEAFVARYRATVEPGRPVVIVQDFAIARSARKAALRARDARRALRTGR